VDEVLFEARPGRRLPLAISVGGAIYPQDGDSYEALLATADSRMYQDKAGRKRKDQRQGPGAEFLASPFPELTDHELQRAAAGIL
jgi:hypothetical protein